MFEDTNTRNRIKKLFFRSRYRGIKEMDLILENFAKKNLNALSQSELAQFEKLCQIADHDLYQYVLGKSEIPKNLVTNSVFSMLREFVLNGNVTDT